MHREVPLDARIFVSGHGGLVGSAIVRHLAQSGYTQILTATRRQVDLRDQPAVSAWFDAERPDYVIHAAGTVGGIAANDARPAEFLYDNLLIHATVMRAAWQSRVRRLLYLGSSCIYPRESPQPIPESALLTGPLEPTNDGYAIAKISGVLACRAYRRQHGCDFIAAMPTNLYGPHDNFDLEGAHVLPALVRKFHEARMADRNEVVIWGSGTPRREFLHVDDLARACLFLLEDFHPTVDDLQHVNVGTGEDIPILELAQLVGSIVHPDARIVLDRSRLDGTPRKLLDVRAIHSLGWRHSIPLRTGIETTYRWYVEQAGRVQRDATPASTMPLHSSKD